MHRAITTCFTAVPFIHAIETAIQTQRWIVQGYNGDGLTSEGVTLSTYYGLTKEGGGGISVELNTLSDPNDRDQEEDLRVSFNFSRSEKGDAVSNICFVFNLTKETWHVHHAKTPAGFTTQDKDDPAKPLAESLEIELDGEGREIRDTQTAIGLIKMAADFAFEHCNG